MINFNESVTVVTPRCALQHTVAVEQQSNPPDARYAWSYVRKVDVILILLTVSISQPIVAEPCYWRLHYPPRPIIPSHCSSLFGVLKTATYLPKLAYVLYVARDSPKDCYTSSTIVRRWTAFVRHARQLEQGSFFGWCRQRLKPPFLQHSLNKHHMLSRAAAYTLQQKVNITPRLWNTFFSSSSSLQTWCDPSIVRATRVVSGCNVVHKKKSVAYTTNSLPIVKRLD